MTFGQGNNRGAQGDKYTLGLHFVDIESRVGLGRFMGRLKNHLFWNWNPNWMIWLPTWQVQNSCNAMSTKHSRKVQLHCMHSPIFPNDTLKVWVGLVKPPGRHTLTPLGTSYCGHTCLLALIGNTWFNMQHSVLVRGEGTRWMWRTLRKSKQHHCSQAQTKAQYYCS